MKKKEIIIGIIALIIIAVPLYIFVLSPVSDDHTHITADGQLYTCGMHPDIILDEPGNCPICEMELTPIKSNGSIKSSGERKILFWRAPMDPNEIYDEPGKSKMGMDLVPVYEDEADGSGIVTIDPQVQQYMNVKIEVVVSKSLSSEVITNGVLATDETKEYIATTRVNGWIEKLYINYTGQKVRKGDKLMDMLLPTERLRADLQYISTHLPGIIVAYHDPNFAVKFDNVMNVMETIPEDARNPYIMESSLTILRGERLHRLRDTNCAYVAPGIESWADYSNKAGVGAKTGIEKLDNVVAHFRDLHEYVPGLGAGFIFGTDADAGDEPMQLMTEFIRRVPFVWPQMNIPVPYGGTPMFDKLLAEGRILRSMPFSFYYTPYVVTTLRNYSPLEYYEKLIAFYSVVTSTKMLVRRLATMRGYRMKIVQVLRTLSMKDGELKLRRVWQRLRADSQHRTFHEGRSLVLPEFYRREYRRRLGLYAELMSEADMTPELAQLSSAAEAVTSTSVM